MVEWLEFSSDLIDVVSVDPLEFTELEAMFRRVHRFVFDVSKC